MNNFATTSIVMLLFIIGPMLVCGKIGIEGLFWPEKLRDYQRDYYQKHQHCFIVKINPIRLLVDTPFYLLTIRLGGILALFMSIIFGAIGVYIVMINKW